MYARMILVDSTRLVIKNVLDVLSITAPEKCRSKYGIVLQSSGR